MIERGAHKQNEQDVERGGSDGVGGRKRDNLMELRPPL